MAALEEFTKNVISKTIASSYPHLKLPSVMYATILSVAKLSDTYTVNDLVITNKDAGTSFSASYEANWYEYTLEIIDRFGNSLEKFPLLPGVRSKVQLSAGAVVAISLPNGDLSPTIIGEVVL